MIGTLGMGDPVERFVARYNEKRQSRELRSIDGSPLVNLDSNIDTLSGPISSAGGGGGGGGGPSTTYLQTQIDEINARLAAASGSGTCTGPGMFDITISI